MEKEIKLLNYNLNGFGNGKTELFLDLMEETNADIIAIQETRTNAENAKSFKLSEYSSFAVESEEKKYGGVALYYKQAPIHISTGAFNPSEGRVITAEYDEFYLINIYLPNSGTNKESFVSKTGWTNWLIKKACKLKERKKTIIMGDLNIGTFFTNHAARARGKSSAGWVREERELFQQLKDASFTDVLRNKYPTDELLAKYLDERSGDTVISSKWHTYDYILVSTSLLPHVKSIDIHTEYQRPKTKHLPLEVVLAF